MGLQQRHLPLQLHLLMEPLYELLRLGVDAFLLSTARSLFFLVAIASRLLPREVARHVAILLVAVVVVGLRSDAQEARPAHPELEGGSLIERQLPLPMAELHLVGSLGFSKPLKTADEVGRQPPRQGTALGGPHQGHPQQVPRTPSQAGFLLPHGRSKKRWTRSDQGREG